MKKCKIEAADVQGIVSASLKELIARDKRLFVDDVSEMALAHKFAQYLETRLREFDVDCEYNKNHGKPKCVHLPVNREEALAAQAELNEEECSSRLAHN